MTSHPLGQTGYHITPLGYSTAALHESQSARNGVRREETTFLLNRLLDLGIAYFDTAPSYGNTEADIGSALNHRRDEFLLSTKTGKYTNGDRTFYDYSKEGTRTSVENSLKRLATEVIDVVFVHSNGSDLNIQTQTDVVPALLRLKEAGKVRAVGFAGKTVDGAGKALEWADVIMVEYHLGNASHAEIIEAAVDLGIGVVVKKPSCFGQLPAETIRYVLGNSNVTSFLISAISVDQMRANMEVANEVMRSSVA